MKCSQCNANAVAATIHPNPNDDGGLGITEDTGVCIYCLVQLTAPYVLQGIDTMAAALHARGMPAPVVDAVMARVVGMIRAGDGSLLGADIAVMGVGSLPDDDERDAGEPNQPASQPASQNQSRPPTCDPGYL